VTRQSSALFVTPTTRDEEARIGGVKDLRAAGFWSSSNRAIPRALQTRGYPGLRGIACLRAIGAGTWRLSVYPEALGSADLTALRGLSRTLPVVGGRGANNLDG
jgi:hypothetical protein